MDPGIIIVFGGPHVSRFQAGFSVAKEECVDVVVQGEGELTLIDIIERVKAGKSVTDCPGTLSRKDGAVIDNKDRELIKNLDVLPFADFSDFDLKNYRDSFKMPLMSSRGCVNRCIFCNERPYWRTYRSFTAERLFKEVAYQLKLYPGIDYIDFQDSLINGNIKELERFADLIIDNKVTIRWSGQAVIRKEMTFDLLAKLKRAGCIALAYGLETASTKLMLKIGKVASMNSDPEQIVRDGARAEVMSTLNFMFGLPGETEDDFQDTVDFFKRNSSFISAVNPSPCFCYFANGTLGFENPSAYGLDFSHGQLYWETVNGDNNYRIRMRRFEAFCRLVKELKIYTTYPSDVLLDKERALGEYYFAYGRYNEALLCYKDWVAKNPEDGIISKKLQECCQRLKQEI